MPLLQGGVGSRHQEGKATGAGDPGSPWQWGDPGLQSMDSRAKVWVQILVVLCPACATLGELPVSALVSPSVKWVHKNTSLL